MIRKLINDPVLYEAIGYRIAATSALVLLLFIFTHSIEISLLGIPADGGKIVIYYIWRKTFIRMRKRWKTWREDRNT